MTSQSRLLSQSLSKGVCEINMLRREFQLQGHHQWRRRPWPRAVLAAWRAVLCNRLTGQRVRNGTWRLQKERTLVRLWELWHTAVKRLVKLSAARKDLLKRILGKSAYYIGFLPSKIQIPFWYASVLNRACQGFVSVVSIFHLPAQRSCPCGEAAAWYGYLFASECHSLRKSIRFWPLSCQV